MPVEAKTLVPSIYELLTLPWPTGLATAAEIAAGVTPVNFAYQPGNVLRYGTNTTPGTTDMTTAIQNAINSMPSGGTVYFPSAFAPYKFSSVSTTKVINLVGDGFTNSVQDVFGAAAWSNTANYSGSVLISTATSGDAIAMGSAGSNQICRMRDLMIVGPGSGTTVGVHLLRGIGTSVYNVLVANFSTCWHMENVQDASYNKLAAYGSNIGVILDGSITSNQCSFYTAEVQTFNTFGIHIVNAAQINLYSCLIQDGRGGYGVQIDNGCSQNFLLGCWFENTSVTGAMNILGQDNRVQFCDFGNPTDNIVVGATSLRTRLLWNILQPSTPSTASVSIIAGATDTYLMDTVPYSGVAGSYTDGGTNTIYITTTGGTVNQQSGSRGVFGTDSMGGLPGAQATSTKLLKRITGIADNTFTSMIVVTIPNAAQAATIRVKALGSLGAGGAIGADEGSMTLSEDVVITRTAGLGSAVVTSTTYGSATASVAGGATCTVSFDNSLISGGVGATQTLTMRIDIARGSGASTNHTCLVQAEVMNANSGGITIS